jgi:hypothetical protein
MLAKRTDIFANCKNRWAGKTEVPKSMNKIDGEKKHRERLGVACVLYMFGLTKNTFRLWFGKMIYVFKTEKYTYNRKSFRL